jgi:non-heme chloroperoxidase
MTEPLRFTASDGAQLAYSHTPGQGQRSLVLLHGWSGSRRYWDALLPHLQRELGCPVYALDLRWHGDSVDAPETEADSLCQLARLAQDVQDFTQSRGEDFHPVFVGASMGASVLWAWHERFGRLSTKQEHAFVFVDQAPLQNRATDWALGSKGCCDDETLAALQAALVADMGAFADANAACCLSQPISNATAALLKAETLRCDPVRLGRLMAEHTAADWRPVLPSISVPCLIVYGPQSGCFPVEGCTYVAGAVQHGTAVAIPGSNHWLYIEQPEEFARIVATWMLGLSPEMETRGCEQ